MSKFDEPALDLCSELAYAAVVHPKQTAVALFPSTARYETHFDPYLNE